MNPRLVIYSDGAYSRLRNVGSYAFIVQYLVFNKEHEEYQLIKEASVAKEVVSTTNNRCELLGAIEGLKFLKHPCDVEIISDATYVVDTINKWLPNFIKDPTRLNHDLMIELHKAIKQHKSVKATWVRGHSSDIRNQRVNELAQRAAGTYKGK